MFRRFLPLAIALALTGSALAAPGDPLRGALAGLGPGPLYDRVLPLAGVPELDGSEAAPAVPAARWRQALHELRLASAPVPPSSWPTAAQVREATAARRGDDAIPLAVLDVAYSRLQSDAMARGVLVVENDRLAVSPGASAADYLTVARAFAATALVARTYRGESVAFVLPRPLYVTSEPLPARVDVDFDDGLGLRAVAFDAPVTARYASPGPRTLRLRASHADGRVLWSRFPFEVVALRTPVPSATWPLTADIPFGGATASGEAYVYLADGHAALEDPVVVIEGFDLDDSMGWDVLYALLNQENLLEDLRAQGRDAVILNFTSATDPIQRNAYLVVKLLQTVQAAIAPGRAFPLDRREHGRPGRPLRAVVHGTRGAAARREHVHLLRRAAAGRRHPAGHAVLAGLLPGRIGRGRVPAQPARHAGRASDAAVSPHDATILRRASPIRCAPRSWRTSRPSATTRRSRAWSRWPTAAATARTRVSRRARRSCAGNTAASSSTSRATSGRCPTVASQLIFDGEIDLIWPLPDEAMSVTVAGTQPWDGAPGGSRASMAEMDAVPAPYGDIIALHPAHAFIPTVSALALAVDDPFHDIAGDPDLLSRTPFAAVYYPGREPGAHPHHAREQGVVPGRTHRPEHGGGGPGPCGRAAGPDRAPEPVQPRDVDRLRPAGGRPLAPADLRSPRAAGENPDRRCRDGGPAPGGLGRLRRERAAGRVGGVRRGTRGAGNPRGGADIAAPLTWGPRVVL